MQHLGRNGGCASPNQVCGVMSKFVAFVVDVMAGCGLWLPDWLCKGQKGRYGPRVSSRIVGLGDAVCITHTLVSIKAAGGSSYLKADTERLTRAKVDGDFIHEAKGESAPCLGELAAAAIFSSPIEAPPISPSSIFRPTRPTAIPMNWSGNTSKPTRLAEWRSPTRRISTPRSVHPCANYKTTPRKSVPSIKSHPSNTLHEVNLLMD